MKTPEELAEEYAFNIFGERYESLDSEEQFVYAQAVDAYVAAYKAAQDQLADADKVMPQWISVEDRMPEPDTCVLIRQDDTIWVSGFCNALKMWGHYENGETCAPTHWMPLPEPPKEEK
jgi:hypothetical protein